jgi:hypothetical protein
MHVCIQLGRCSHMCVPTDVKWHTVSLSSDTGWSDHMAFWKQPGFASKDLFCHSQGLSPAPLGSV